MSDSERERAYATVQDRLVALSPALFLSRGPLGTIAAKNVGGAR